MKKLFLLISLWFAVFAVAAQPTAHLQKQLQLRWTNTDRTVKLRWAPTTPALWKLAQEKGFILERITLLENDQPIDPPVRTFLSKNPILPANEEVWKQKIAQNAQAAIIAQAFWGKSFKVGTNQPSDQKVSVLDQSVDDKLRFAFSLMAADQNFEAAQLAGWGFVDETVTADGYYKYRVYLNDKTLADSVLAEVNVNRKANNTLPSPFGVKVNFDENSAKITWELSFTRDVFSAYYIERSVDSINFVQLNKAPFIMMNENEEGRITNRAEFIDSVSYDTLYAYRVRGIDCFGQLGPYSKPVKAKAIRLLKVVPEIMGAEYINTDTVKITWAFDPAEEPLLKGFELLRAKSIDGDYEVVSESLLPGVRECRVAMIPTNYILVRAIGWHNDYTVSGAIFVQQPDDTPPNKPDCPNWKIDSLGVVTLTWKPNTDKDIKGYHVYYQRLEGEEFFQLNTEPLLQTTFIDTVTLNTFIEEIHYQIRAVDQRNNHSVPSDTVFVKLPDLLKPVSPYFLRYNANADSVTLEWVNSSSHDVATHFLYRKKEGDDTWSVLARFDTLGVTNYTDHQLDEGQTYVYLLSATDDDGLVAEPSDPVSVYVSLYKVPEPVEKFTATLNREKQAITLKWKYDAEAEGFQLYKQEDEFAPFLYKFLPLDEKKIVDNKIKPFANYRYKIRTKGKNGKYSPFVTVTVNW